MIHDFSQVEAALRILRAYFAPSRLGAAHSLGPKAKVYLTKGILVAGLACFLPIATIGMEESSLWRERYRVLFDRTVAGIILTNVEGRVIDCNEPCARIVGFDSREDMLAHSALISTFTNVCGPSGAHARLHDQSGVSHHS